MITSASNPKVRWVQELQARRRSRAREQRLVAEGARLVEDAMAAGVMPDFVLCTAGWSETERAARLHQQLRQVDIPVLIVSDPVMAACSDTDTPQGVLAVLPWPDRPAPAAPTFVLVVDGLRIPGNLGTVLRTAAAAGAELVLLPPGNVDPYNPKVVRGGMGAHFRLALCCAGWDEIAAYLGGLDVWLAAADHGQPYHQVDWVRPVALILGGEASGAGERGAGLLSAARSAGRFGGPVHIPMPGGIESLNAAVAAGILLFEVVRQRSRALSEPR